MTILLLWLIGRLYDLLQQWLHLKQLTRSPTADAVFCAARQTRVHLPGLHAAVRFPLGPPARPGSIDPLARPTRRLSWCRQTHRFLIGLFHHLAARFTGTLRASLFASAMRLRSGPGLVATLYLELPDVF
ncbi:hypothetical protein VC279_17450 [Xanthomonas sp. WHRI 10064A]|uniref:hypothetical protein n=1 Tax=Xanthomonas TaxID=338 RepID=UPI00128FF692|nr:MULTISPECIES: hypothetical protein [Xanthomonas]MEA9587234.1 hypothetical protein [Xanthomonas sp. WHRI 10064B]MEA9616425.1 hypothetical protein [Xanthomonas sp. WHRI 10064A]